MNTDRSSREYPAVDIMRLVMSIVVITAHTRPFDQYQEISWLQSFYITAVAMAVPFFFLCIGFFLNSKLNWQKDSKSDCLILRKQAVRFLKIYLILSLVYLPLAIVGYIKQNIPVEQAIVMYLKDLVLAGEHYNSYHLWFLLSAFYALIILYFIRKGKGGIGISLAVGAIFLLLSFASDLSGTLPLFSKISDIITKIGINARILTGLFYIVLGMALNRHEIQSPIAITMTIVCLAGYILLRMKENRWYLLVQILLNVALFLSAIGINRKAKPIHKMMRTMSKYVYYYHMWIWTILYAFVFHGRTYGMLTTLCTTLVSLLVAYIIVFAKEKLIRKATRNA